MPEDSTAISAKQKGPLFPNQKVAPHLKATVDIYLSSSRMSFYYPHSIQSLPHSPPDPKAFC